ncbi:MAG TPA: hypothetical protein VFC24_14565 [Casimicrobiaceae bacterium]|nr:hypothetical protein [Casimicrobiaceae bacterium]
MSIAAFEPSPDGTLARVTIAEHELVLDAQQLDRIIEVLATARQQLEPAVPMQRAPLGTFVAINSPLTMMATDFAGDGAIFSIRDPGRGWVHYRYFGKDLREMRVLIDQIIASHGTPTTQ